MTREQRFYVIVRNGFGAALVNALLNAAIGWGITRGLLEFPVWQSPGVAGDLLVTAFGITFGTGIVVPLQVKWDFSKGRIALPELPGAVSSLLARFPRGLFRRAAVLGALSIPLFAPPALFFLVARGAPAMERVAFVEFKALFSAIQGGIVTPFIVLSVLSELTKAARAPAAAPAVAGTP